MKTMIRTFLISTLALGLSGPVFASSDGSDAQVGEKSCNCKLSSMASKKKVTEAKGDAQDDAQTDSKGHGKQAGNVR